MKYIFVILMLISFRSFSQVSMATLNQKIDSLSLSMDSTVFKNRMAPNAAYIILDTLSIPVNSFGFFTLYYCSYDTVQKFIGQGVEEIFISRVGTAYSDPIVNNIVQYSSNGTSTHQIIISVIQSGGIVVIRADGFSAADPIRWHIVRQAKIAPL
jgi:hypothetical protein